MRGYETTFILNPNLTEEQENAVLDKLSNVVTSGSGEVVEVDRWGKKRLAYEVKGLKEGSYIVFKFRSTSDLAKEFHRVLGLQDEVLRSIMLQN
ncbi:MAG: 30S ribosomal protein S6 [Armatimonadota bacterium]